MKRFGALVAELDAGTAADTQQAALVRYLREACDEDAAWAVYLLTGGKPRPLMRAAPLRALALRASGLPEWLFEESLQTVGHLAETIALVLPEPADGGQGAPGLHTWMSERLPPLRGADEATLAAAVLAGWAELDGPGRGVFTQLVVGGFRAGVTLRLVQHAVAELAGLDPKRVAARWVGRFDGQRAPTAADWRATVAPAEGAEAARDPSQPYPFFLAQPLAGGPGEASLGAVGDWFAEWMFDGIRAQVIKRAGRAWVWSRGEELLSARFPELERLAAAWPDGTVLEGEIVAWDALAEPLPGGGALGRPGPFATLQQRLARKTLSARLLADAPVAFIAHDLLERGGQDLRSQPLHARRAALEALANACAPPLTCSPLLGAPDWATLAAHHARSRELGAKGLMLKHRDSAYGSGRAVHSGEGGGRLAWWKWAVDPLSVHGVLLYAQAGPGRRASGHTDYSFAVWSRTPRDAAEAQAVVDAIAEGRPPDPRGLQLVSVTKADSGLNEAELQAMDAVIRDTTLAHFGPVRSLRPTLVVALAFDGVACSKRHKSGLVLRAPRMLGLRGDKALHEAGTLGELQALLPGA